MIKRGGVASSASEPASAVADASPKPRRVPRLSLSHELLLLFAAALCFWHPMRVFIGGGACAPALLARSLAGKNYVVTGATAGIGFETAAHLAAAGATVVLPARDASRGEAAAAAIRSRAGAVADVRVASLDLADFDSVRAFASEMLKSFPQGLHGLVCNAGVMLPPKSTTKDGLDLVMQTNHYSHWLLTELLLPALREGAPSRIVILSSAAAHMGALNFSDLNWETRDYGYGVRAYAASKLANALHARELAKRLTGTGVTAVSVDPGGVDTELQRHISHADTVKRWLAWPFLKTAWQGAQTTLYCLLADDVPQLAGRFFADAGVHTLWNSAFNDENAAALWKATEAAVERASRAA